MFCSADAVYILAISVIMLNTDKHNPAVRALPPAMYYVVCFFAAPAARMRPHECLCVPALLLVASLAPMHVDKLDVEGKAA